MSKRKKDLHNAGKQLSELTYSDKVKLYNDGSYLMPAPPVCTGAWDQDNWIKFIDINGKWVS